MANGNGAPWQMAVAPHGEWQWRPLANGNGTPWRMAMAPHGKWLVVAEDRQQQLPIVAARVVLDKVSEKLSIDTVKRRRYFFQIDLQ